MCVLCRLASVQEQRLPCAEPQNDDTSRSNDAPAANKVIISIIFLFWISDFEIIHIIYLLKFKFDALIKLNVVIYLICFFFRFNFDVVCCFMIFRFQFCYYFVSMPNSLTIRIVIFWFWF